MSTSYLARIFPDLENSIKKLSIIGVPAIINSNGARELLELELSEKNQAKLDSSAKILRENMENIRKVLNTTK